MAVATSETDDDEDEAEAEDRSMRRFLASYCAVRLVVTLEMIVGFNAHALRNAWARRRRDSEPRHTRDSTPDDRRATRLHGRRGGHHEVRRDRRRRATVSMPSFLVRTASFEVCAFGALVVWCPRGSLLPLWTVFAGVLWLMCAALVSARCLPGRRHVLGGGGGGGRGGGGDGTRSPTDRIDAAAAPAPARATSAPRPGHDARYDRPDDRGGDAGGDGRDEPAPEPERGLGPAPLSMHSHVQERYELLCIIMLGEVRCAPLPRPPRVRPVRSAHSVRPAPPVYLPLVWWV